MNKSQETIFSDEPCTTAQHASQPTILNYCKDLPNLCSFAGLACTVCAIYFSILGIYYAAMIGMVWAVAFDWADGLVARGMPNRTCNERALGGQLDVLIDIVSYGVSPAILLMSFGNFEPFYLLAAFIILAASALRLSYFATYGLTNDSMYTGLALDNNNLILVFVFLFESIVSDSAFTAILLVSCLLLAALNVSQIETPKFSGHSANVYRLAIYTLAISCIYMWKLFT